MSSNELSNKLRSLQDRLNDANANPNIFVIPRPNNCKDISFYYPTTTIINDFTFYYLFFYLFIS